MHVLYMIYISFVQQKSYIKTRWKTPWNAMKTIYGVHMRRAMTPKCLQLIATGFGHRCICNVSEFKNMSYLSAYMYMCRLYLEGPLWKIRDVPLAIQESFLRNDDNVMLSYQSYVYHVYHNLKYAFKENDMAMRMTDKYQFYKYMKDIDEKSCNVVTSGTLKKQNVFYKSGDYGGHGAMSLFYSDSVWYTRCGGVYTREQVIEMANGNNGDMVLVETYENNHKLKEIVSEYAPLMMLRIPTVNVDESYQAMKELVYLRVGQFGSDVDNFSAGGTMFSIKNNKYLFSLLIVKLDLFRSSKALKIISSFISL